MQLVLAIYVQKLNPEDTVLPENVDEIIHEQFMKIGKRIKTIRLEKGLNQIQLGAKIGIVGNYICNIETGRSHPTMTRLMKLAMALDVPVTDFLVDLKEQPDASDISLSEVVAIAKALKTSKEKPKDL